MKLIDIISKKERMIRRVATMMTRFAPMLMASRTIMNLDKNWYVQLAACKTPIYSKLALVKGRSFATKEKVESNIKELTKMEDWEDYSNKVSNETPLIVEFFAK